MMRSLLVFLLLTWGQASKAQDRCTPPKPGDNKTIVGYDSTIIDGVVVYRLVDEPAQFVGGITAMRKYIADSLNVPPVNGCFYHTAKVFLQVIVLKDGSISDVKIMRGVEDFPECDNEAIRLVKSMPNWIPAKVNGQPVNSFFNLPVKFNFL